MNSLIVAYTMRFTMCGEETLFTVGTETLNPFPLVGTETLNPFPLQRITAKNP